jgi:molybdopterin synthase sulfur carrier subunit
MPVNVRIPEPLRKLTNGADLVALEAGNVREMIDALEKAHPGIKERICDEKGNVRRFVNVFVNEEDIRFQDNLDTKLSAGTEVSILPAIAGGNAKAAKESAAATADVVRRVYLTFNSEQCTQPIIYHLVKKFDVVPNIRGASVTEDMGIMSVEFSGKRENVDKALEWARKQGLKVDPIEMNVVEP